MWPWAKSSMSPCGLRQSSWARWLNLCQTSSTVKSKTSCISVTTSFMRSKSVVNALRSLFVQPRSRKFGRRGHQKLARASTLLSRLIHLRACPLTHSLKRLPLTEPQPTFHKFVRRSHSSVDSLSHLLGRPIMKNRKLFAALGLTSALLLTACGGGDTEEAAAEGIDPTSVEGLGGDDTAAEFEELYTAATEDGQDVLTIYTPLTATWPQVFEAFEQRFPEISIEPLQIVGAELDTK